MEKEMFEIIVSTEEGRIHITQPNPMTDGDSVRISPEQVDGLVKWLEEAKAEIEGNTIS